MLLKINLQACRRYIKETAELLAEDIVPSACPAVGHSPYRPGYDWLFYTERRIARILDPWLKPYRQELIGPGGLISEALSNAYCHGSRRDALKMISINVWSGERGLIVRIADTGDGFSLAALRNHFEQGKGYFSQAGHGFRQMVTSRRFGVFFNSRGNAFHLVYLLRTALLEFSIALESFANRDRKNL